MKKYLFLILLLSSVISLQAKPEISENCLRQSALPSGVMVADDEVEPVLSDSSLVDRMMAVAAGRLGCRYRAAGKGPNAFDCAGYTRWVYLHFGYSLAPYAGGQLPQGRRILDTRQLRPGDLAFYGGRGGGRSIGHVVLVTEVDTATGHFRFIHAASGGIMYNRSTEGYWRSRYIAACRVLPDEAWMSPRQQQQDSLCRVMAERCRAIRIADSMEVVQRRQDSLQQALRQRLKEAEEDVDAHRRPSPAKKPVVTLKSDMALKPQKIRLRNSE